MPTLAKRIERFFLGEDRTPEQDATIEHYRAQIEENTVAARNHASVMGHMSNMIKLMAEGHVQK